MCCSSPERFLHGSISGMLEARPIKGTAPRSEDPAADAAASADLAASEKDRAENLMIVNMGGRQEWCESWEQCAASLEQPGEVG